MHAKPLSGTGQATDRSEKGEEVTRFHVIIRRDQRSGQLQPTSRTATRSTSKAGSQKGIRGDPYPRPTYLDKAPNRCSVGSVDTKANTTMDTPEADRCV
jgi:hypothetical protein